jgi:hypothetical protein
MNTHASRVIAVIPLLAIAAGCTPLSVKSPILVKRMQLISAGHTGCLPDDNEISNVTPAFEGHVIWNATCKGKVYLCTEVSSALGGGESFSCAPAVQ